MAEPYKRTAAQRAGDFARSFQYEEEVQAVVERHAGPTITKFSSTNDLDVWVPGYYIEIKEKRQHYGQRWQLDPNVPEEYLFIMDELTIRRALRHYPEVFFLVRDVPGEHLYIIPIWEIIGCNKIRRNRNGKGKWLVDMRQFREIPNEEHIVPYIHSKMVATPWLDSGCQSTLEVLEI